MPAPYFADRDVTIWHGNALDLPLDDASVDLVCTSPPYFGGTGTVALMARVLGRQAHHVDLSADYCRLAQWRVTDPGERARAMQVEKPAPPPAGVDALFDLEGTA